MKPRVLIDVDDVLTDFLGAAEPVISEILGRPWSAADIPEGAWDMLTGLPPDVGHKAFAVFGSPGWVRSMRPSPEAQDALKRLEEISEVFVVTAAVPWAVERNAWLEEHFGISRQVVYTTEKYICEGEFMVDDSPAQLESWLKHHRIGTGFLWETALNKGRSGLPGRQVSSWEPILEAVQSCVVSWAPWSAGEYYY